MTAVKKLRMRQAASGGTFSPDDISGLRTWMEPDLMAGFSSGDPMDTWTDLSPASVDATLSSGTAPTWQPSVINGRAVGRFSGSDLSLPFASHPLSGASAGTVFVVFSVATDPPSSPAVGPIIGKWGSHAGVGEHWPFSDGEIYSDWGSTARKTVGNPSPSMTSPRIAAIVSAASDWRFYFEGGSALFSTTTNTVGWLGSAPTIGRCVESTQRFAGDIAAIIAYDTALSLADINDVGDYLSDRYALTWSTAT